MRLPAFSTENCFTTVVKSMNLISVCSGMCRAYTNQIQELYNSCKAIFYAERNYYGTYICHSLFAGFLL